MTGPILTLGRNGSINGRTSFLAHSRGRYAGTIEVCESSRAMLTIEGAEIEAEATVDSILDMLAERLFLNQATVDVAEKGSGE